MIAKDRTLQGAHKGERLFIGYVAAHHVDVTIWDGMLLLKRNSMPHQLVKEWRGRYIVGGRFWRLVPHAFVKNPLNYMLYEDTLCSVLAKPFRNFLIPGYEPHNRLTRYILRRVGRFIANG